MRGEETVVGYIIREETVLNREESAEKIEKLKTEGEKVSKGETVAKYYTTSKEDLEIQINELDTEIQTALEAEKNIFSSDINALDNQIESKLIQIAQKNNIQEINENKKDINNYIIKKAKISGSLSPAGSNINSLMEKKNTLEKKIIEGSKSILAPSAGVVSYRIDNLEEKLDAKNLDGITSETLNEIGTKTGKIVSTSENLVKIVNNFKCYIAVESNTNEAKNAEVGDNVTIRFSTGEEVKAKIENIKEQKKSRILFIKVIENVEKLINYRKITIEIVWWRNNGLKVPNTAIIYDNGLSYVVKRDAGKENKILVKVIKENDNYSIVRAYKLEELAKLGFSEEEINKLDKINLYDEIIVNPNI